MAGLEKRLNVLLVEDDAGDAHLVRLALSMAHPPCRVTHATCVKDAVAAATGDNVFDAILLDLSLPDSFGFSTVTTVRTVYPNCPIVVLTGLDDPTLEDKTVHSGAQDYLIKGSFDDQGLMRAIRHAITRQSLERRLVASETEHRTLINLAPDAIMVVAADGTIAAANPATTEMFGTEDVVGVAVSELLPDAPLLLCDCTRAIRGDGSGLRAGNNVSVSMAVAPLGDGRAILMVRDITERVRLTAELQQLARTDPLTGLANRRVFTEAAEAEFQRCKRFGTAAALLMIDIDHFKRVNDQYGHESGDAALVAFAKVLMATERNTDLPARFGGEEFIVLLTGTELAGAMETAERIRKATAALEVASPSGKFRFTVSIGTTIITANDGEWCDALHRADRGLYQAKSSGRNRVVEVDPANEAPKVVEMVARPLSEARA